jgi:predicted dehydrogenase
MNARLDRVGIVGAGNLGIATAKVISGTDLRFRAEVVAVADTDLDRARRLAGDRGRAYASTQEMCAKEDLDWVYLATPDPYHRDPFIELMAAGVPTLVEKPFATTLEDAVAMREAAQTAGVVTEVNFANHTNPAFVAARRAIDSGQVGNPLAMYARLSNKAWYPLNNLYWAGDSSSAWFLLSHVNDLACWLTGWRAETVLGRASKGKLASQGADTYDVIQSLVTYADGNSGIYESSWVRPDSSPSIVDFEYMIYGDEGEMQVSTTKQMVTLAGKDGFTYPGTLDWSQTSLDWWLDQLEAGPRPGHEVLADGLHNTAILVALHKSIESRAIERVEA